MENIINLLEQISVSVGVDFGSIMQIAIIITVITNYLKSTKPFSNFVKGGVIPVVVIILSAITSIVLLWGSPIKIVVATIMIAVISIGGWASAKILAHKINVPKKASK